MSQQKGATNVKATSAFHMPQVLPLPRKLMPLQSKVLPQAPLIQSTSSPKATNQQIEITRSTGQRGILFHKGNRKSRARKMETAALTSA